MLTLLIDFLKGEGITGFFTVLTENGGRLETSDIGISSLIDTWMLVRDIEVSGERNRGLYVLKSRGMNHSNQIREFLLSNKGIRLVEVYLGPSGMLTGSARVALEEQERDATVQKTDENDLKLAQLEHRRKAMEAHIEALRAEFEADSAGVKKSVSLDTKREKRLIENQTAMAKSRRVGGNLSQTPKGK
jgi:circadian clock protein KaiC